MTNKPKIVINDPKQGKSLNTLHAGDFFRFPNSADGAAYVVTGFPNGPERGQTITYMKLCNGHLYRTSRRTIMTVDKLRLVSVEFELED